MKCLIAGLIAIACCFAACKPAVSVTARPDPNTSTSGTIGSVKATNGVLPLGERRAPHPLDTLVAKH